MKHQPKAIFEYLPPPADEWEFPRNRLLVKEEIGTGEFGSVHKGQISSGILLSSTAQLAHWNAGTIQDLPAKAVVAVKMCRNEISLADIKDFFGEIEVMKRFSKPFHSNVGVPSEVISG